MIYNWKPRAQIKIDAQAAGAELENIRLAHNGRLETGDVVSAARDKASVLHDHFEWDDVAAAEKFRLEQAGYLIRSIEVIVEEGDVANPIRAFVSVTRDSDRSYTSIQHAMSDDELRQQVIAQAWSELEAWRQRHAELIEFAAIFSVVDQALAA